MLVDMKVTAFLDELKSDSPAPGGGSISALAGALGAGLSMMVSGLTEGNAKYESAQSELVLLKPQLEGCIQRLTTCVDEDTAMFNKVMDAYRLPKSTDEEKAQRSAAIQLALKGAAELPLEVANLCKNVLVLSKRMLQIGNTNAASDAAVAGQMAHAGMWGAIYNVRINLGTIKDTVFVEDMKCKVANILAEADVAMQEMLAEVESKIGC